MSMYGDRKGQVSLPQNLHIEHPSMAPSPLRLGGVYGNPGHQQAILMVCNMKQVLDGRLISQERFASAQTTAPCVITKMRRSNICLLRVSSLENSGHGFSLLWGCKTRFPNDERNL